ncbi:MAG: nuclear transport factor 2 family protein [Sphingorhabdus sp.]
MTGADICTRLGRLEAESDIRRLAARYFQICDNLGPDTPFSELANLFTPDARWEGKGRYQEALGSYRGREAIVEMIRSYCVPKPHFALTAHFFSSEFLLTNGDDAHGEWMMLQTSEYADGKADLRSAAISMEFKRKDLTWRIHSFCTRNLFSRRTEHWNDTAEIPVPDSINCGASK